MQDRVDFGSEAAPTVSLREYGDILRRRRAIILQTFVIVLVAGVLITLFQTPTYRAAARLLVEPQSMVIQNTTTDPLSALFTLQTVYTVQTQVELLQSSDVRKSLSAKMGQNLPSIEVKAVEGTSIIEVVSEGDNPERVAQVANQLLKVYQEKVGDDSVRELGHAYDFAARKAKDAKELGETKLRELESFKSKHNIPELQRSRDLQIETVNKMNEVYRATESMLLANTTKQTSIQSLLQSQVPANRSDVPAPEADMTVQRYQEQIAMLEIQKAGIQDRPGTDLYQIKSINIQLSELNKRLYEARKSYLKRTERVNPTRQRLGDQLLELTVEASTLASLAARQSQELAEAKARLERFPSWESRYRDLQGKIEGARLDQTYYETRAKDLDLRRQTKRQSVRPIDDALPPNFPIRPKKAQNILFSALLGLFLGFCLALVQELFDDRINSPEEAERVLRLPNLGHVPLIEEEGLRLIRDISTFSPLMESYRSLRTNINFAAVGTTMRSIVITSSVPAEGKSTTVANLAMALALDGKRVIIVDADLRRPSQHKLFRIDSSPGLTDILVGTHGIEDCIRPTGVDGVSIIPAGSPPPNPAELLGSHAMVSLITRLEGTADIILFDSPPTLAVADAVVLSARTDGVLLVVGFGETKKANVKKAQDLLMRAKASLLGTVLNRMEGPNTGYYYGKYYVPATFDSAPSSPAPSGAGEPRPTAAATADRYRIAIDDLLTISAIDIPAFASIDAQVLTDGTITLPEPVGQLRVAGMTTRDVETTVEQALATRYIKPSVSVTVPRRLMAPLSGSGDGYDKEKSS